MDTFPVHLVANILPAEGWHLFSREGMVDGMLSLDFFYQRSTEHRIQMFYSGGQLFFINFRMKRTIENHTKKVLSQHF